MITQVPRPRPQLVGSEFFTTGPGNLRFKQVSPMILILEFGSFRLGLSSQHLFVDCQYLDSNDVKGYCLLNMLPEKEHNFVGEISLPWASPCACASSLLSSSFAWHSMLTPPFIGLQGSWRVIENYIYIYPEVPKTVPPPVFPGSALGGSLSLWQD